jgi:hypothetical protein
MDCSAFDDACNAGVCVPATGTCRAQAVREGLSCEDGDLCTAGETCVTGVCAGGGPMPCDEPDACTDDVCDAGACLHTPNGSCSVSGQVRYYRSSLASSEPGANPVAEVPVDHTDDAAADTTTDSAGAYAFAALPGAVRIEALGRWSGSREADRGAAVTSFDAVWIARHAVGLVTLSPNQQIAADVSGNGAISSFDAARVSQFSVELIDHFEVAESTGSDWKFLRCDHYAGPLAHDCQAPLFDHTSLSGAQRDDFFAILYGDVTGNWSPPPPAPAPLSVEAELHLPGGDVRESTPEAAARSREGAALPPVFVGDHAERLAALSDRDEAKRLRGAGIQLPGRVRLARPARVRIEGWKPLAAGAEGELQLTLTDAEGIAGLDLTLTANPSVLQWVGVRPVGLGADFNLTSNVGPGSLRCAAWQALPVNGSGPVLAIRFRAQKDLGPNRPRLHLEIHANEGAVPLVWRPRE